MPDKHIPFVSSETGKVDVPLLAKDITGSGTDYALEEMVPDGGNIAMGI